MGTKKLPLHIKSSNTDASGRIREVIYSRNGQQERQRCRYVFLCAGTIETARLLLINDLANSSG